MTTVYNFEAFVPSASANAHGSTPLYGLAQSHDDNLYGTTLTGGPNGAGTIFKITPDGALTNLSDGGGGPLIQGVDGNLYGVRGSGSSDYNSTVFRLSPAGESTVLYKGTDFAGLDGNLIEGTDGSFYGTTARYGTYGGGTVFTVTPAGALTILHNFMDSEGVYPSARLTQGKDGNFYGTTSLRGTYTTLPGYGPVTASGTVFRITPAGELTVLHAFEPLVANGRNDDGGALSADLVLGEDGNFYSTTQQGGANGTGTIFRITPDGMLTTLYSFSEGGGGQFSGLCEARDGRLYGFTENGGANGQGMLFDVTPDGTLNVLYSFDGSDGSFPTGSLVQGNDGNFYGTTLYGGLYGGGTVYKLAVTALVPRITSSVTANGSIGVPFSYQIVADAAPTNYSATGLPAGLVVNPATGLISGVPTTLGTFTVTLSAGNAQGTGTATLTLTVAPVLPTVTLMATMPQVTVGSGEIGRFALALSKAQDHDVTVQVEIKGNASAGTDYTAIQDPVTIKAGKTTKIIKIRPLATESQGPGKRTVTLLLQPGDGYTVGTTGKVKVKISTP